MTTLNIPDVAKGRVIELQFTHEQLMALHLATEPNAVQKAIGYLSVWGTHNFPHVQLSLRDVTSRQPEMLAVYRQAHTDRLPGFVMGAVWRPEDREFSFHS